MAQVRQLRRTSRPTVMWVPVTDVHGRTRMEMRWSVEEDARTPRTARTAA